MTKGEENIVLNEIELLNMEIAELRESNQALKAFAEDIEEDKDEQAGRIIQLEELAKDLYFAYINKDADCPHSFETQAIEQYKKMIGGEEDV